MHTAITKAFKRYNLFGFTGTPIFAVNAGSGGNPKLRTTAQAFGCYLHGDPAGVRRAAPAGDPHLHDRRRDQRQERPAVPHRLRQHDQDARGHRRQAGVGDRHRACAARLRSGCARSSTTPCEHFDQKTKRAQHYSLGRQAGPRLQRAVRDRVDRRSEALLRRVQGAAGRPVAGPAAQGRPHLLLRRQRGRRRRLPGRGGLRDQLARPVVARLPRRRDQGLQRHVRHELRHVGRQVPELLQGPVAAAEEPRDRPRDRRQHVPDRLRRDDAEHPVRRQAPGQPRPDPGVLAHQPHPQLGQDLRQHRLLPRPRGGDQRRHRAVRQQGRTRHRPAQAVRRLLQRVRRARPGAA